MCGNMKQRIEQRAAVPGMPGGGFTIIEVILVVLIIGIAAAVVVPMVSSAGGMQIRAAVNMVAADLEYAKSMAISRGQPYSVVFDKTTETYQRRGSGRHRDSAPGQEGIQLRDRFPE